MYTKNVKESMLCLQLFLHSNISCIMAEIFDRHLYFMLFFKGTIGHLSHMSVGFENIHAMKSINKRLSTLSIRKM